MATRTIAAPGLSTDANWRTHNLGALLFAATDRSIRDKLGVMHASGFGAISEAQLTLFHHLDRTGTRVTVIAARAGLTKQAMIELVDRAEALGLVGRRPDPNDKRAKIVYPTKHGVALLKTLERAIALAEARVGQVVGADFLAEMKQSLGDYAAATSDPAAVASGAWRMPAIGRLMALSARCFAARALEFAHKRGFHDVSEVLLALFRNLDFEGTRLTDIAARARMTKQSMGELVDRATMLGLVGRHPDAKDRRAKTIRFTASGLTMLDGLRRGLELAEDEFGQIVGPAFTARLTARLIDYAAAPAPRPS